LTGAEGSVKGGFSRVPRRKLEGTKRKTRRGHLLGPRPEQTEFMTMENIGKSAVEKEEKKREVPFEVLWGRVFEKIF